MLEILDLEYYGKLSRLLNLWEDTYHFTYSASETKQSESRASYHAEYYAVFKYYPQESFSFS